MKKEQKEKEECNEEETKRKRCRLFFKETKTHIIMSKH